MSNRLEGIKAYWAIPSAQKLLPNAASDVDWLVAEIERLRDALHEITAEASIALAPTLEQLRANGFDPAGASPQEPGKPQ